MRHTLKRRDFVRLAAGSAATVALGGLARFAATAEKKRPNFLFLFTDDQTFRSIGSLNNPDVRTLNIDRLIKRGVTFTHCFNQGSWSGAICVCSRAMLNTGRYLWTCAGSSCGDYPLWGQTLGKGGYDTFVTGKWHNGPVTLKKSFKTIGPTGGGMYP